MLIVGVFSKITDGFDAEYFDDYVAGRKILIEEVVVFVLTVNRVNLALAVEAVVEVLHDVLNHHNFKLALVFDEFDDILEGCALVFGTHKLVCFDIMQANMQNLLLEFKVALFD